MRRGESRRAGSIAFAMVLLAGVFGAIGGQLASAQAVAGPEIKASINPQISQGPLAIKGVVTQIVGTPHTIQTSIDYLDGTRFHTNSVPVRPSGDFEAFFSDMPTGVWTVVLEAVDLAGNKVAELRQSVTVSAKIWTVDNARSLSVLTRSTDFAAQDSNVLRLYWAFFNRQPDLGGAKYWLETSRAGASLDDISYQFSTSAEFDAKYGQTTDAQFVDVIYGNVLGREPDQAGYEYWYRLVVSGELERHEVVRWIAANQEFIGVHPYPDPVNDRPVKPADPTPNVPKILWAAATSIGETYAVVEFETNQCMGTAYTLVGVVSQDSGYPGSQSCWTEHIYVLGAYPSSPALLSNTEYTLEVSGVTTDGSRTAPATVTFKTLPQDQLSAPTISGLSVSDITETTARITFEADQCTGLEVKVNGAVVHTDGIPFATERCWLSHWSVLGTDAFGGTNLVPGSAYEVEVRVFGRDGRVSPAQRTSFNTTTGDLKITACSTGGEVVTISNTGQSTRSLNNYALHDETYRDNPDGGKFIKNDFEQSLAPGQSLQVVSGPDVVPGPGQVLFVDQHIWNDEGDTAFLLDPGGNQIHSFICPPKGADNPPPAPGPGPTTPEPTTPTTPVTEPEPEPGFVELVSCDSLNEVVVITNTGGTSVSLVGFVLHDEQFDKDPGSGKWIKDDFVGQLAPAESLRIVSGLGVTAGPGEVLFEAQNIWNNGDDTAYLLHSTQIEQTVDCS